MNRKSIFFLIALILISPSWGEEGGENWTPFPITNYFASSTLNLVGNTKSNEMVRYVITSHLLEPQASLKAVGKAEIDFSSKTINIEKLLEEITYVNILMEDANYTYLPGPRLWLRRRVPTIFHKEDWGRAIGGFNLKKFDPLQPEILIASNRFRAALASGNAQRIFDDKLALEGLRSANIKVKSNCDASVTNGGVEMNIHSQDSPRHGVSTNFWNFYQKSSAYSLRTRLGKLKVSDLLSKGINCGDVLGSKIRNGNVSSFGLEIDERGNVNGIVRDLMVKHSLRPGDKVLQIEGEKSYRELDFADFPSVTMTFDSKLHGEKKIKLDRLLPGENYQGYRIFDLKLLR